MKSIVDERTSSEDECCTACSTAGDTHSDSWTVDKETKADTLMDARLTTDELRRIRSWMDDMLT